MSRRTKPKLTDPDHPANITFEAWAKTEVEWKQEPMTEAEYRTSVAEWFDVLANSYAGMVEANGDLYGICIQLIEDKGIDVIKQMGANAVTWELHQAFLARLGSIRKTYDGRQPG